MGTPNELKKTLAAQQPGAKKADVYPLLHMPLILACCFALLLPAGLAMIIIGMEDLFSDLGASISPLGLMVFGIGVLGTWFNLVRTHAAWKLKYAEVSCDELRM